MFKNERYQPIRMPGDNLLVTGPQGDVGGPTEGSGGCRGGTGTAVPYQKYRSISVV